MQTVGVFKPTRHTTGAQFLQTQNAALYINAKLREENKILPTKIYMGFFYEMAILSVILFSHKPINFTGKITRLTWLCERGGGGRENF